MKKFGWLVLALLILSSTPFIFSQQGYEMVVRGGGDVYFTYTPYSNFSQDPQIWITFKKGGQAAGQHLEQRNALRPGQAAWLDRRIEDNEPDRIIVTGIPDANMKEFTISWTNGKVMGVSSAMPYLSALQDPNKFVPFVVYNDGRGNFIATKIGSAI